MKLSNPLRFVVITIISLPIAFLFITWFVNLAVFDEELAPELVGIVSPIKIPAQQGNAYFAMWGISTAADKDMLDSGLRLLERYLESRGDMEAGPYTESDYTEILGSARPDEEWLEEFSCNARTQYGCLSKTRASLKTISMTSQRARVMMDRHQQILLMPVFQAWADHSFTSPLPSYGTTLKLSQLKLASLYDSGLTSDFLQQLAIDMRFWKMMLADGFLLIDKMFAVAAIWTDIQYLSEYLIEHDLNEADHELVTTLLQALTNDELNIAEAFVAEQRSLFTTLQLNEQSLPGFGPLVAPWLIQNNATQNAYYKYITGPVIYLSGLSGAEFFEQTPLREQKNRNREDAHGREAVENMTSLWPGTLYNLGGKVLLSKLLGYPADYIARIHDLNSMIGLVKVQLSLKTENAVLIEQEIGKLNSDAQLLTNQFAGRKLSFDLQDGWLGFDCQYQRSVCKIMLNVNDVN